MRDSRFVFFIALCASQSCTAPSGENSSQLAKVASATNSESSTASAAESSTATSSAISTDSVSSSGTDATPGAGTVALELAPVEMFQTIGAALVSVGEVKNSEGIGLYPGNVALTTELTESKPCKNSGGPNVDNDDKTISGTARFAGWAAYCDLSQHPDGPDTTLGGIDRIQGLLCAMDGQYAFDGVATEVLMKVDTTCFSEAFVAMAQEMGVAVIKHVVTARLGVSSDFGSPLYEKSLHLEPAAGETVGFAYDVTLTQEEGTLAAAVRGGSSNKVDTDSDAFAIRLTTSASGSIRYEGRFSSLSGNSDPKARHLRVLAEGNYDATLGTFTSLSKLNYLYWDVYFGGGDSVMTVTGAPGAGYLATKVAASPAFELSRYNADTYCYAGDCNGNSGLTVSTTDDFAFAKSVVATDPSFVDAKTWFKRHGPLSFSSVSFAGEQD